MDVGIFYGHIPIEISSSPHASVNCPGLAPIPKLFGQETRRLFQKPPWAKMNMGRPWGKMVKIVGKTWENLGKWEKIWKMVGKWEKICGKKLGTCWVTFCG